MTLESSRLALEASHGDQEAVDELLVRHLPGLRTYVHLKVGGLVRAREAESDIVQSVCREVLQRAGAYTYGGEAGFRHWLFTTALRKILDKRAFHTAERRDVRSEAPPDSDPGAGPAGGARFASPSGVAMGREELERMSEAFEELDPDHKEVILLSRVVGLSRAEVAAEMDRTEASVRNLLHRGLARLSRRLGAGDASSA
jgi:RNA polymerase sigma-70 factor (ECF subfamily)